MVSNRETLHKVTTLIATNTHVQRTILLSVFNSPQTHNPIPNIVAPSATAKTHAVKTGVVAAADFLPFPRLMPKGRP